MSSIYNNRYPTKTAANKAKNKGDSVRKYGHEWIIESPATVERRRREREERNNPT